MYAKFVGISSSTAMLIEGERQGPEETEDQIIERALRKRKGSSVVGSPSTSKLDIGQGIELRVGEELVLFLGKTDSRSGEAAGKATVGADGLYIQGKRFPPSRGSYLQAAMEHFQKLHGHTGVDGKPISLSAYRQWFAQRDGKLVRLEELKHPDLKRTRRGRTARLTLEELGLA